MKKQLWTMVVAAIFCVPMFAFEYPYVTIEPQKTGWPLTDDERAYVLKPEFERRPGAEQKKHLPTRDHSLKM